MIRWFNEISLRDIDLVGGKNASLGEMFQNMHTCVHNNKLYKSIFIKISQHGALCRTSSIQFPIKLNFTAKTRVPQKPFGHFKVYIQF